MQAISIYVESLSAYSDAALNVANDVLVPRLENAFWLGELPDLTIHAYYCHFWGSKEAANVPFETQADRKLIEILAKAQPSPCKGRSIISIIAKSWVAGEEGAVIFDCVTRIIMGGLLGIYPHNLTVANFAFRRLLYGWYSFSSMDRDVLEAWLRKNKTLLSYILREFLFFTVEQLPGLNDFMEDAYSWHSMRKNCYEAMDAVRELLNKTVSRSGLDPDSCLFFSDAPESTSILLDVEELLSEYNKRNLKFCPRHIDARFLDKVNSVITAIDIERALEQSLGEIEESAGAANEEIREIREFVEDTGKTIPISYYWLFYFYNVSLYWSIMPLETAELFYSSETDRTVVRKEMKAILKRSPRDYEILKAFFRAKKRCEGVRTFGLPDHAAEKQIEQFAKKYGLLDGDSLPLCAGIVFVCPNCFKVTGNLYRPEVEKPLAQAGVYDVFDFKMYCKKIPSATAKRGSKSSGYNEVMELPSIAKTAETKRLKKLIREELRFDFSARCCNTELVPINILGRILWTEKHGCVVFCPECTNLTVMSRAGFKNSDGVFSCGCAKNIAPWNDYECCLCDSTKQKRKAVVMRLVYDDESEDDKRVKMMHLCKKHRCRWIEEFKRDILKISVVRRSSRERWYSYVIDAESGERIFEDRKKRKYLTDGRRM